MMLYAIKRNDDFPFKVSSDQNTPFYLTHEGCEKAIKYFIRTMKKLHNQNISDKFEILAYNIDLSLFKQIGACAMNDTLEPIIITPEMLEQQKIKTQIEITIGIDNASLMGLRGDK